jgi:hypothetical protein
LPGLLERVKNILLSPKSEWPLIASEPTSMAQLYSGYVMPLAVLATVISFVHMSLIGVSMPFGGAYRTPLGSGIIFAVVSFGFALAGVFLVGVIINALAPTFAGERDLRQAVKTAAYAFTPGWLSSVFSLLGGLGSLVGFVAALYGIYLLYLGLPAVMKSPREKAMGYTLATVICTLLLGVVFGVASAVTGGFGAYGRMPGTSMSAAEEQQRAAATVGGILGGVLGTDQKGKESLGAAIDNLAEAGRRMEQQQPAVSTTGAAAAAQSPPQAPAAAASDAADPQSAAAATASLLSAVGGALGGSRPADPVDFHALKDLLPASLPDLRRSNAEGSSQQAMGVKGSSASADYQGSAGARLQIKISDLAAVSGLLKVAGSLVQNVSSESDTGYERDATVAGRTVHEKYDSRSKHGEVSAIIAKRFSVEVTGDGMDMAALEHDMSVIDLSRLEAMKDAGLR